MTPIDFRLYVDWNDDFDFGDATEDITDYIISLTWNNGHGRLWQEMTDEPTLQATLHNPNGLFNPENAGSSLYGKIMPRRLVKLTADGVTIWKGWLKRVDTKYQPGGAAHGQLSVTLYAEGFKQRWEAREVSIGVVTDQAISDLIKRVIRFGGAPPALEGKWRIGRAGYSELGSTTILAGESDYCSIDAETITLPRFGEVTKSAWDLLSELVTIGRGKFLFDRTGKAIYWNKERLTTSALPTRFVHDEGLYGGKKPVAMDYDFGRGIINAIRVTFSLPPEGEAEIALYTQAAPISLTAGTEIEIDCYYRDELGETVAAQPNTARVEGVTWASGAGTVSLITQKGDYGTVKITCTSTGDLSAFQIIGRPKKQGKTNSLQVEDQASIFDHNRQEMRLRMLAVTDPVLAQTQAQFELTRRAKAKGLVGSLEFLNANDGVANAHHVAWNLGDLVAVMSEEYGHNRHYLLVGERHTLQAGMRSHQTIFYLEPLRREWLVDSDGNVLTDSDGQWLYA